MVSILTIAIVGAFVFLGGFSLTKTALTEVRAFGRDVKEDIAERQAKRQAELKANELKNGGMREG